MHYLFNTRGLFVFVWIYSSNCFWGVCYTFNCIKSVRGVRCLSQLLCHCRIKWTGLDQTLVRYCTLDDWWNIGLRYFMIAASPKMHSIRPVTMIATPNTAASALPTTNRKISIHKAPRSMITEPRTMTWNPRRRQNEENSLLVLTSMPSIKSRCFPAPLVKERVL